MTLRITILGFSGSNASETGFLLAQHAGLPFEIKQLMPIWHAAYLKARGFPGMTVPAMRIDHQDGSTERITGTKLIAQRLDELAPDAGLFPQDPRLREKIVEAEAVGERLQNALRRIMYVAARDDDTPIQVLVAGTGFGRLPRLVRRPIPRILRALATRAHRAHPERLQRDLARVRETLDYADALVAEGVLCGERPTAADLQLAPNLSAILNMPSSPAALVERPCMAIARRWFPKYKVAQSARLPDAWIDQITRGPRQAPRTPEA